VAFVPPVIVSLVNSPIISEFDLSSVRQVMCGAASLSRETELEFEQVINAGRVRQGIVVGCLYALYVSSFVITTCELLLCCSVP